VEATHEKKVEIPARILQYTEQYHTTLSIKQVFIFLIHHH